MLSYADALDNAGRWGASDVRGTLNHLTVDARRRAASTVSDAATYSLAREISAEPRADQIFGPPLHLVLAPPFAERAGEGGVYDDLGLPIHGFDLTHLDALSHTSYEGRFYGGRRAGDARRDLDVRVAGAGILARALLLDVPAHRGVDRVDHGRPVLPAELDRLLESQGLTPLPGDAYLLYTGRGARTAATRGRATEGHPGWHVGCLPWLRDHGASVVGCDTVCEYLPSGYGLRIPFHTFGISAMGLWLIDNMELDRVADRCRRERRYDFALVVSPLTLAGGTGSPVNPLAVF